MDKTVLQGTIDDAVVKTAVKGSIEDCVSGVYHVLCNMASGKSVEDVMFDVMHVQGEENAQNITSAHLMARMDSGEILSKDLSFVQTFALMCALGLSEDMSAMSDEEIMNLLGGAR